MRVLAYMEPVIDKLKALAEETRLRIIRALALVPEGLCVCEIEILLGKPQYAISRHLQTLRRAGLVTEHREGRNIIYSLLLNENNAALFAAATSIQNYYEEDLALVRREFSDYEHRACRI